MATDSPTTTPWQIDSADYPIDGSLADQIRFILCYAILAPSSHNTEPWKFRLRGDRVDVLLDFSRWLKVADDDQRELHISVGCALENLLISLLAAAHGIWCQPMSQIVQVPELKAEVATLIPESELVPQHPFRMGYASAEKQHTPRRPLEEVLV